MSESIVILLGLLIVSCPVSLFIVAMSGAVVFRALRNNGKENGNDKSKTCRRKSHLMSGIANGDVYRTLKPWIDEGWNYSVVASDAVAKKSDIILSKVL